MRKALFVLGLVLSVSIAKAEQTFSIGYCEEAVEQSELYLDKHGEHTEQFRKLLQQNLFNSAAAEAQKANDDLEIAANWASIYDAFCKD